MAEVEIENFTVEEQDVESPPPGFRSKFKSIPEWLDGLCQTELPPKAGLIYNFGLMKANDEYILYLVGQSTVDKDEHHSIVRIEFQPTHMYYPLPKEEFGELNWEQVEAKVSSLLERFIANGKFRTCFMIEAKSITTGWKGEIWSRGQQTSNDRGA